MVKCLIKIKTTVNVHLCMINHCYRDVKVRVLSLGPRMLGKALGVLPLYPILTGLPESASALTGLPESASASPLPRSTTPLPRSTTPLPDTPTGRFISTRGPWEQYSSSSERTRERERGEREGEREIGRAHV